MEKQLSIAKPGGFVGFTKKGTRRRPESPGRDKGNRSLLLVFVEPAKLTERLAAVSAGVTIPSQLKILRICLPLEQTRASFNKPRISRLIESFYKASTGQSEHHLVMVSPDAYRAALGVEAAL
jgi:hypothetical protein